MLKHKIIDIIMGTLMISGVLIGASSINNTKITNDNTKVINKVLLSAPSSVSERAVVINTDNSPLVLYSKASSNSTITSYISVGEMLTILSSGDNFYKVKVQETGAIGYISAHNLQIITSGINDPYSTVNKDGYIINVSSKVNLRANATMGSNILAKLSNNTKINVLGKQGEWYKVNCNGTVGYIYQEYVGINIINSSSDNNGKQVKSTVSNSTSSSVNTSINSNNKNNQNKNINNDLNGVSSGKSIGSKNSSSNSKFNTLANIQNIVIEQMVQYFKNCDASQHIPAKDLGSSELFYQTAQAIVDQYVTRSSLKDTFGMNGPKYGKVDINSYYSSKKVLNEINIPQREWSTTGNGYYVVAIQKL